MNRLIQGDVGSGKTAVAFLTAGFVLAEGGQAALMAPTEILAEQHYQERDQALRRTPERRPAHGQNPGRRARANSCRASRPANRILLIGTHALIEDPVVFRNLSYIMIDEQHRFGVEQRRALRNKGTRRDHDLGPASVPHTLILTATPIPRTLALTAYGDLAVTQHHASFRRDARPS